MLSGTTSQRGEAAEELACHFLIERGLKLVTRNYRCRSGEIDLVMNDKGTMVFVEVRFRSGDRHGGGAESVDKAKQRKLTHTALHYLQKEQLLERCPMRFDVIAIRNQQQPEILWIPNAF